MLRYRFVVPLVFAIIAAVLAIYGFTQRKTRVVMQATGSMIPGDHKVFDGIELIEGRHYRLTMGSTSGVPLNRSGTVGASLMDEDENYVFEVEDSYWHQRGTWREGGESGTWEEQNAITEFDFRPPATGEYELRIDLFANSADAFKMGVRIDESQPFRLAEWPLLIVALLLLVLAGWIYINRNGYMAEFMRSLGVGAKIEIRGDEYEVTRLYHYSELGNDVGAVEFELTGQGGIKRYLALEAFEREWTDSEDNDHIAIHKQVLMDIPISREQAAAFEAEGHDGRGPAGVMYRGELYNYDEDNSGTSTIFDLTTGQKEFARSMMYRGAVFPRRPGQFWLERTAYHSGEVEWGVMEIMGADEIKIIDPVEHKDSA